MGGPLEPAGEGRGHDWDEVLERLRAVPGVRWSVAVRDTTTGATFTTGATHGMHEGSIAKLDIVETLMLQHQPHLILLAAQQPRHSVQRRDRRLDAHLQFLILHPMDGNLNAQKMRRMISMNLTSSSSAGRPLW